MSAFKQLLASDVIVSPLEVSKGFSFASSEFTDSDVQIDRFKGVKGDYLLSSSLTTGTNSTQSQVLVYDSIKELYYSNYLESDLGSAASTASLIPGVDSEGDRLEGEASTTNYYNYLSTDLAIPRFYPTSSGAVIGVISVPSRLFGDKIAPNSVRITSGSYTLVDDGEGTLYVEGSEPAYNYGNVIYEHGIITLTDSASYSGGAGGYGISTYGSGLYGGGSIETPAITSFIEGDIEVNFSSSYEILETQYKVTVRENEFNFSLNPSLISGSEGDVYEFATSSYFSPFVTTVGLYNDNQELLAIGKLSQPLPTSRTTDTNIFINIDR